MALSPYDFVPRRDAAALACTCAAARAGYSLSKWPNAVRIGRSGAVLEPVLGFFDVTLTPGESLQAGVDCCPPGGSVLLCPGTHDGPLVIDDDMEVHLFGRGRATLRVEGGGAALICEGPGARATVDGLTIVQRPQGAVPSSISAGSGAGGQGAGPAPGVAAERCDASMAASGRCMRPETGRRRPC